jgi:peptidoglycan-associated lipoprotein
MTLTTRATLLIATAALLAACSSPVKLDEVPVESRNPTAAEGAASGAAGAGTSAATSGTSQSQVATVNTGAAAPAAALSQRTVYFDFDSFELRDDSRPVIDSHAKALTANRSGRMVAEGHTDNRGGREYNLALGQKRAEAVVRSLTLLGANANQLEAVSFGKERPAAEGSDEATHAKNRRVELKDKP